MTDADKLALGLDEIIRLDGSTNRRGGGAGRGGVRRGFRSRGGGGRGGGNFQGTSNGFRTRGGGGIPRSATAPAGRWKHDLYEDNGNRNRPGQRTTGVTSSAKLLLSNLDYGVTTNDIQELFEDIGAVRVARVHYDESGRSLGTGEVIYERRVDAVNAQQKYNGVNLDGRPMDIRIIGGNEDRSEPSNNRNTFNNGNQRGGGGGGGGFRNNNQQNNNRAGANRSRGGGRGQQNGFNGNSKKESLTTEDLDAELEAYRAESAPKK